MYFKNTRKPVLTQIDTNLNYDINSPSTNHLNYKHSSIDMYLKGKRESKERDHVPAVATKHLDQIKE